MPAAAPISLREVAWELRHISTTAGLLALLKQIHYWIVGLGTPSPSGGASVSQGTSEDAADAPKTDIKVFPCNPTTVDAAARQKFVQQMSAKRKSNPALWTADVAASFKAVLQALDKFSAAAVEAAATKTASAPVDASGNPVPNADIDVSNIDFARCDPMFLGFYKRFYARDANEVLSAVTQALQQLKTSKDHRPRTITGNGAQHILHVVNLRAGNELLLQSVRLLAEAALHDSTEATFFDKGAVEAAMRIGRECKDMEIRCHAARLFFNLAFLKVNRPAFIRKGGLHHISYLARTTEGDTWSGNAQKLILFAAKTMYQLSCADESAKRVFYYSGFQELWLTFARHPTQDVRQRAAGVFNKVVELKIASKKSHAGWCQFLVDEILHGVMAGDSNNNAAQAQKKARTIASAQGWRTSSGMVG